MSGGNKRKVDAEDRQFPQNWTEEFFFVLHNGYLNDLNLKLQKQGRLVNDLYSHFKAFQIKICLWEAQMLSGNSYYLTTLSVYKNIAYAQYAEELELPSEQFSKRFSDFKNMEDCFNLFATPTKSNVQNASIHLQMELIETRENSLLKSKFEDVAHTWYTETRAFTQARTHTQARTRAHAHGHTHSRAHTYISRNHSENEVFTAKESHQTLTFVGCCLPHDNAFTHTALETIVSCAVCVDGLMTAYLPVKIELVLPGLVILAPPRVYALYLGTGGTAPFTALAVTHPSTDRARRCLTSVIGREPVYSAWYGRWRTMVQKIQLQRTFKMI
ncbi:General transcription factor II-I repeat domain-containing protein 2 [Eumeta japonica]|uniref:General transcription factor II-I repeat domain-containing protein 2 n=1 Tax=Eumeta variegata TaxID=151549 RepID=A0A4C1WDH7_EUMVA|nr:General transcription factor II-I repeat domain-containing protein 2 [Eumeta japonica]